MRILVPRKIPLPESDVRPLLADVDGDGGEEFITVQRDGGNRRWRIKRWGGQVLDVRWTGVGNRPVPVDLTSDLDGDGSAELVAWKPVHDGWMEPWKSLPVPRRGWRTREPVHPMYPSGESTLEPIEYGRPGDFPLAGDLDGDGRGELVIWRPSTGEWFAQEEGKPRRATSVKVGVPVVAGVVFGRNGDVPLIADVNGDGKDDLVVWRRNEGTWHARTVEQEELFRGIAWGRAGDIPLTGDVDGDGREDLVVWRPDEGTWHARSAPSKAGSGAPIFAGVSHGRAGDVPLVGDVNRDGVAELVIWRATDSSDRPQWFVATADGRMSRSGMTMLASAQYRDVVRAPARAIAPRSLCGPLPLRCCPPGQVCLDLLATLIDVQVVSYVPPRFTRMGDGLGVHQSMTLADMVADVPVHRGGERIVWPGCRYSVLAETNKLRDDMTLTERGLELFTAWMKQWSEGYDTAKQWVGGAVAEAACSAVSDTAECRSAVRQTVVTGLNVALTSMGIPPDLPDLEQLRQHGIEYLAAEAASYAVNGIDEGVLSALPPEARTALYEGAYEAASSAMADQLDEVIPPAEWSSEDPASWGHPGALYSPHAAILYVRFDVKPERRSIYEELLAHDREWPLLWIGDENDIFADVATRFPGYIPEKGLVVPYHLAPSFGPRSEADRESRAIYPGHEISRSWLETRFGIDNIVWSQRNHLPTDISGSDYDLFYGPDWGTRFHLVLRAVSDGFTNAAAALGLDEAESSPRIPYDGIADRSAGRSFDMNRFEYVFRPYYGLMEPPPRCDGKPNLLVYPKR